MARGFKTGGRRPGSTNRATLAIKDAAQAYTTIAIETLASVMRDPHVPPIARVKAAGALLDRGHGRPTQHIEAKISPLDGLSDEELAESIAALRSAMAAEILN